MTRFHVGVDSAVPGGDRQVRMEFTYDGGGLAEGGAVTLFVEFQSGDGRVEGPSR